MISIFKHTKDGWEAGTIFDRGVLVCLSNPNDEEIDIIAETYSVPLDFITDPLDLDERARIEKEDEATLSIIRIPVFDETNRDIPFFTMPIGLIFTQRAIICISSRQREVIFDFLPQHLRDTDFSNHARFLLKVSLSVTMLYLKYLKEINSKTNQIQAKLYQTLKNEELIRMLNLEKSLVYFPTSLKANDYMFERLKKVKYFEITAEEEDLIDDLIIENRQAIEMATIYSDILNGMMDAFSSVISNNLNNVMKTLTIITICLMIPNLVAGFFGQNVPNPLNEHPLGFAITITISLVLVIITVYILRKRRML